MGRLLYILLLLLVAVGCSEEVTFSGGGGSAEEISFSAGSLSRSATVKESWTVGDKVAVFVADGDGVYSAAPFCYEIIDESGAMDATGQSIYNDGVATTFTAFYPFDSELSSYGEYVARGEIMDSAVDYLFCDTTTVLLGEVAFQFGHIYSMLTFNFMWGYEFVESDSFTAILDIGEDSFELVVEDMSASLFVVPATEVTDATLTITVTGLSSNVIYTSDLSTVSEITEWVMGDEHTYSNVVIGTADLTYNKESLEYEIYSAKGLQAFADLVNAYENTTNATVRDAAEFFGVSNPNINARLMNNIDLSTVCGRDVGISWTPIGRGINYKYKGVFDGNNKKVYLLYIDDYTYDNEGLFGYLDGATVSNLGIIDPLIYSTNWYIGALAAYAGGGTVINCCYSTGSVSGAYAVGGLIGQVNSAKFISCYSTASVYASGNYVGGLIGQVASGGAMLYGCYSGGAVDCAMSIGDKGGIIGEISSGSSIVLNGCYFWYGESETLKSVGDANNTLNVLQEGYSMIELNSDATISDLNSAVDVGIDALSTTTKYTYSAGLSTPEFTLKRE